MSKSYRTIQLENELLAVLEKLEDLGNVRRALTNCKTKVKTSYNHIDSIHVKGTKYALMYQDEQEAISDYSKQLKQKKQMVLSKIDTNISALKILEGTTRQALQVSRIEDYYEEQRRLSRSNS